MSTALSIILSIIAALGLYPKAFTVSDVAETPTGYYWYLTDAAGETWVWSSPDGDIDPGTSIGAIMYDNGTDADIYDDAIVTLTWK